MKFLIPVSLILLFLVIVFIVLKSVRQKNASLVELVVDPAENESNGLVDINLSVHHKTKLDSTTIYDLRATYKNKLVGFEIEIPNKKGQNVKGSGNGITIKTLGKQSDDFRSALSDIYGLGHSAQKFTDKLTVSYVDLHQFAKNYANKSVENSPYSSELKLVFQSDTGELAELYLNISNDGKVMEFAEKDEAYRRPLVTFLTKQEQLFPNQQVTKV